MSATSLPTKKFFLSFPGGNASVTVVALFTSGGPSTLIGFAVSQKTSTPALFIGAMVEI